MPLPRAGGGPAGFVLVAPPRGPFALDGEVFALLRTVAREVATYLAEQRALQALMEARQLRDFGKRFAFVAHDIKNVSSQLSLLLANAERHIDNPEFQRDMLETVRASVRKIGLPAAPAAGAAGDGRRGERRRPRAGWSRWRGWRRSPAPAAGCAAPAWRWRPTCSRARWRSTRPPSTRW